jgi:uncharacterized protein
MAEKRKVELRCPICKKEVKTEGADFPFCSERCRTIDLGKWASGAYVVPSAAPDSDERFADSRAALDQDEES